MHMTLTDVGLYFVLIDVTFLLTAVMHIPTDVLRVITDVAFVFNASAVVFVPTDVMYVHSVPLIFIATCLLSTILLSQIKPEYRIK